MPFHNEPITSERPPGMNEATKGQDGTIEVESMEGEGTTFVVKLLI